MAQGRRNTRTAGRRRLAGLVLVIAVSAGAGVAAASPASALDVDGRGILVWGDNGWGQLGNGETGVDLDVPTRVAPGGLVFDSISAGPATTSGLLADGTAYAWGSNLTAQFGDGTNGTTSNTPKPVTMPREKRFAQLSVGDIATLALDTTGGVWGWGQNLFGVLGPDVRDYALLPKRIPFPDGVVVTEVISSAQAAYAIDSHGGVWAWGNNFNAQLAQPQTIQKLTEPTRVQLPEGAQLAQLDVGANSVFARMTDGRVFAWGQNQLAQLGISTGTSAEGVNLPSDVFTVTPVTVLDGKKAVDVSTSSLQSFALLDDGTALGWGSNTYGELGNGEVSSSFVTVPVEPKLPEGVHISALFAAVCVSYALTTDGQLYSWGSANSGALGDGTAKNRPTPGLVSLPRGARVDALDVVLNSPFAALVLPPVLVDELPAAVVGDDYRAELGVSGTSPVTYAVSEGSLPERLTLDSATGVISGHITPSSRTAHFAITATNAAGSTKKDYRITVPLPTPDPGASTKKDHGTTARLPATGADPGEVAWTAGAALVLLLTGAALLILVRRQDRVRPGPRRVGRLR